MLFRYFCLQLRFFYLWGGGLKIPVRVTEAEPKQIGVSLKASGELNFGKYVLEPCISAVGEITKITLLTHSPLKTKCNGNLGSSIHFPLPTRTWMSENSDCLGLARFMSTLVLKFNASNVISKMAPMLPNFIVPSLPPRGLVQEMPCTKSWGDLMASCHRHWAREHKMHAFDAPCGVLCNWSTRANQGQIKDKNLMIFLREL